MEIDPCCLLHFMLTVAIIVLFLVPDFVMDDEAVKRCVAIYWAMIGCVCSFLFPLYLGQDDWAATGDISWS